MEHPKLNKLPSPSRCAKGWGWEDCIVNNDEFCGKILHFNKGSRFSAHFHKEKREVFFVKSGLLKVVGINTEDASKYEIELRENDVLDIPRGAIHQIFALEESEIIEFSTHHEDDDSFRVIAGDSQDKGVYQS